MKLIFTALIVLSTVAATFAEEGKLGPDWVEGHNYKVVDGQLVDLGPAPPTPAQPTIVINNNIVNSAPAAMPAPTPAQQQNDSQSVNRGPLSWMCGRTTATTTPHGLPLLPKTD